MQIHTIDLNFLGQKEGVAAYVVVGSGGPVLVETGPGSTLPTLLAGLETLGYAPTDIQALLVTHIHFDHAGAAGWWAQQGVPVYVHPNGARHLIDPSRLYASAARIYGEQMEFLWGAMLPAPANLVHSVEDGAQIEVAGLNFRVIDTPGHAFHHHAYRVGDVLFTGDAAGVRLPGGNAISVPAPPPEFTLEVWLETIDKLLAEAVDQIYPTHFGGHSDGQWQLRTLRTLLVEHAEFIRQGLEQETPRETLIEQYTAWLKAAALATGLSEAEWARQNAANPLFMSVDGITRYWRKKAETDAAN